jgi:hypothetical protein
MPAPAQGVEDWRACRCSEAQQSPLSYIGEKTTRQSDAAAYGIVSFFWGPWPGVERWEACMSSET